MGVSYVNVVLYCIVVVCLGVCIYIFWLVGVNYFMCKIYGIVWIGVMFEENYIEIIFVIKVVFMSKYGIMFMINCLDK